MTDLNELMKQAQRMQEQFKKAQEEMANKTVQGEAGAGMVKVEMNGRHDVLSVKLDDGLLSEDKEIVEDLVAAAVNDAVRKVEEQNKNSLGAMAGGMQMPEGFKFPF